MICLPQIDWGHIRANNYTIRPMYIGQIELCTKIDYKKGCFYDYTQYINYLSTPENLDNYRSYCTKTYDFEIEDPKKN